MLLYYFGSICRSYLRIERVVGQYFYDRALLAESEASGHYNLNFTFQPLFSHDCLEVSDNGFAF